MSIYNIPIYGLIGSPEGPEDKEKYFSYADLLVHINNAQLFDTLNLDIASNGGYCDVADKMIDTLVKTKKRLTSSNSGPVCSAASKLFTLPGTKDQRSYDPSKGMFLIHNPWGEVEGDAAQLAAASKQLKSTESEYAKWYAAATGSNVDIIQAFMAENTPLTPQQVDQLGFATIVTQEVKAVAKLNLNTNNQMDNKEVVEKLNLLEKTMLGIEKIMAKFKLKAIMVADATGKELEFPELADPSEIAVGAKVNENGAPANGEYPQPDGSVYVCANGVLTEIRPAADPNSALTAENTALKAELETLKAEKLKAEAKATEAEQNMAKAMAEFKTFKSEFTNFKMKAAKPEGDDKQEPQVRKPFKTKE